MKVGSIRPPHGTRKRSGHDHHSGNIEECRCRTQKNLRGTRGEWHYLGAFKRIYGIADDSELGQKIAAMERSLADDEDEDEIAENLTREGSAL